MSRPNTRNKNKRQRPTDALDSSQILRKIHEANVVTDDDINQLFMIWKPICQGCRVNTRDNPNCFCGLVPPVSGSRKSGLWQKTSEIIQALGPDLSLDRRASDSTPAGLTNLGATCYANSILQCLYMNTAFRQGVFSVEVDVLKQYPVLDQIARLFAQLHASKMSFVDSDAFVKTLELDNGVQQDTHEFLTLLLSLLERCLRHSGVCKAKTIVQDLFRGSVSHVTTCSKCGRESEASSKVEDFYALELNVKGLKNLDASLNDYLSLEQLNGDNQYFCGSCDARVDATRCIKLRTLPPVITFQLKRCIFLPKTTAKKKITSSFSFPQVLDMGSRLAESSQNELTYNLSAVLIHKGSAVNSGHYVAHIKDEKTGLWWEFDDEHVSELGKRPFSDGSSSTPQPESNGTASSGSTTDVIQPGSSDCRSAIKSEVFSSSDAYMLMYSLRCGKQENQEGHRENPINITKGEVDSVQQLEGGYLPLHLYEWVNNMNVLFLESCKQFDSIKERELNALTERRQEVRTILSEAAVQSLEEQYFWISTDWLRLWADTILPPALDNTPLLCSHGKVLASKVNCMKRVSELAWTKLESKFNGGPKLGKGDYCTECLMDGARMVVSSDSYRDRRTFMKSIASDVLSGKCEDGMYYISKVWLQQWLKRKNLDAPGEADVGPTNAIMCNHGALLPEQAPGAKRILVPENLWSFLVEDALKVMPEDTSGCPCFPVDSSQCCNCTEELSEVACLEDSLRTLKVKQRQNHEKLATGKGIPLTPQSQYFLLPSPWLVQWRSYINMTGKNSSSAPEPELLAGVINSLKCKKHTQLLERLPELVCRRGSFFQKNPSTDKLTIIPEHDWKYFCEEWGGIMENGVSALIEVGNNTDQSSSPDVIDLEKHSSPDDNMEIRDVVAALSIPVIANGDVLEYDDFSRNKAATGAASVMVARGAMWNALFKTKEMEARSELKQKLSEIFKEFMTGITKLEELGNTANNFLLRFQQGLSILQRPPIVTSSKLIENIIKKNETRRLQSYLEAGCINIHDAAQSTRALHTSLSGLNDHLVKVQSLLLELERLTDEAALAIETATELDKESSDDLVTCDEENTTLPFPQVTEYATLIAVVYSMVKQNYAMQEKIVKSLSLKSSSGELETYTLMWSLCPFVEDEIMKRAWKCVY